MSIESFNIMHLDKVFNLLISFITVASLNVGATDISGLSDTSRTMSSDSLTYVTDSIIADDPLIVPTEPSLIEVSSGNIDDIIPELSLTPPEAPKTDADAPLSARDTIAIISGYPKSIYSMPVSWTRDDPWWHGMWINTAVVTGAYIATLFVLECLPEDATAWNRADIRNVPFYERWYRNIFKRGPEWDHDNPVFNFVLHPYAGAAYFMCARTCGFNFWKSMLYSAMISTVGWEFGIEACMERPSIQDIFITPLVGSIMGEGFYRLKRLIVDRNYEILGTPFIGHILAFFLDPVNEFIGWLSPGTCRTIGPGCLQSQPLLIPNPSPGFSPSLGISFSATF
ncbi:MAG: DUF3943 domain-containing protein [Bacteroidales bacterium]|nr:DUF3943 domain-containing protein [Bacteroidales bacterium]